jgi:flavorubredoxin
MVTQVVPGVYWVGVVDWGLRHFHGHELSTHRGSSYNSYLVMDEKIALVDTVWEPFAEEFVENVRQVVDPARIDYIVVNHGEMDHSGALPAILGHATKAKLIVSKRGLESVQGHYHQQWDFQAVKTGDRISLGSCELVFIEAPMLHWPDSMFTYVTGKNILMPNDAFGQHYAADYRFNDQVDAQELFEEALKYYANILTPYSEQVLRKIDEVLALNLPVDVIAPSHGVIWRKAPLQIVRKYQEWAGQAGEKRVVVLYDTMWNATRKMAEALGEGVAESGLPYKLLHLALSDRSDTITEIFRSRGLAIGSPTLNRGVLPTVAPILEDLRGLRFKNKLGAAFGSSGWGPGESVKQIEEAFGKAGIALAAPGVSARWQPRAEDLDKCRQLGRALAAAVK